MAKKKSKTKPKPFVPQLSPLQEQVFKLCEDKKLVLFASGKAAGKSQVYAKFKALLEAKAIKFPSPEEFKALIEQLPEGDIIVMAISPQANA